ncbi:hypothetical protein [Novosphingobium sp.]|uniref:hypothetical protein n=1 Tax=Novosphingobium sp. TaxID=1874826 RepID=UPI003B51EBD0
MRPIWIAPLAKHHCQLLAPLVCEADRLDLIAHGSDAGAALATALQVPGGAWAAGYHDGPLWGAFGWTEEGSIWSMWRELTRGEQKRLLKLTPEVVRALAEDAGRPLGNVVWEGNSRVISWLKASKCFTFLDNPFMFEDRPYMPFFVKPLGDLLNV